ncbi:hypothetical protein ACFWBH_37835 [Streptomyces sp. NPDC059999]|uniref:hypothetical protein n=1 Tax=Streptomyces sp. NPDC059999 TaxID=3347030 RepID=UPI0036C19C8A
MADAPLWDRARARRFADVCAAVSLPTGPGLGFTIDRSALRRRGRRTRVITAGRLALRTLRDKGPRVAAELARTRRHTARPRSTP